LKKTIFYITCLLLVACVKELPFPDKPINKGIVLNAILEVGKPIRVHVSETFAPSNVGQAPVIPNATVRLFDSAGAVIEALSFDPQSGYYIGNTIITSGTSYKVDADEPTSFYYCVGSDKTPQKVTSYVVDTSLITFQGLDNFFQFDLTLSDDPNERNFYQFYCKRLYYKYVYDTGVLIDSTLTAENMDLQTNDFWFVRNNNLQYSRKELLLVDEGFRGQVAFPKFGTYRPVLKNELERTVSITLYVNSLSLNHFIYTSSLNEHLFYQSDPFSQTTSVFSNITGGYGIVGSSFSDSTLFEF